MQRFFFKLMTMKVNVFLVLNNPRCCCWKYLMLPQLWLGLSLRASADKQQRCGRLWWSVTLKVWSGVRPLSGCLHKYRVEPGGQHQRRIQTSSETVCNPAVYQTRNEVYFLVENHALVNFHSLQAVTSSLSLSITTHHHQPPVAQIFTTSEPASAAGGEEGLFLSPTRCQINDGD